MTSAPSTAQYQSRIWGIRFVWNTTWASLLGGIAWPPSPRRNEALDWGDSLPRSAPRPLLVGGRFVLYVPLAIAYLSRRLARALVLLFGITLAVFLVVHLSGDPTAPFVRPSRHRVDHGVVRVA